MKLKTKLFTGFGIKLLLILILTMIMIYTVNQLNQSTHEIVKDRYQYVKMTTDIRNELSNMNRSLSNMIMSDDPKEVAKSIQEANKYRNDTDMSLKELDNAIVLKNMKSKYTKLYNLNESFEEVEGNIISLVSNGQKEEAKKLLLGQAYDTRVKLFAAIDDLISAQEGLMDEELDFASNAYHASIRNGFIIMFIFLFMGLGVTFWVVRSTTGSLKKITDVFSRIDSNNTRRLPRLDNVVNDEVGAISKAFNNMAEALEKHAQEEENLNQQMREQNWLDSKMAEITLMYQGVSDIKKLANLVISKLAPLIEATYGVFYIREKQNGLDQLVKAATYAGHSDTYSKVIHLGDGLVGQCAKENKKLLLNEIPNDYIKISSGLGEAKPTNLYLLPIEFEGNVIGVLEFASFKPFLMQYQILLDRVLRSIGITINSILNYMEIQRLLEESQTLTEELQSQSEELQLQQEELKSTNEKLEEQYKNSEQKTAELEQTKCELEKKANQLTLSNQYKSQFLANMSHELRTPLNSLLILSQTLTENREQNLTEKQIEYAKTISASGHDLLDLINDILDLSKIESGKMTVMMEQVSFVELSLFVKQQFHLVAEKKGLLFNLLFSHDLPHFIKTDRQHLQQIIKNLLSNAFKFTNQGKVEFEVSLKPYMENESSHLIAISVTDTGIGIPKDKQTAIFEAFQQADGTTSRKFGGTGLGLSISKKLADLIGGYIEVESTEGKGSRFTLYIPDFNGDDVLTVAEAAPTMEMPKLIESIDAQENQIDDVKIQNADLLKNKKVLIIDDDMRNIFALTTILENRNILVEFAENGKEGLKLLEGNSNFDLILMDIMMPVMDGYEAMKQIRSKPKWNKIPIIALTAKAMKLDKEKCIEAGASDYISKPIDIEKLFSLMTLWLNR